MPLGVVTANKTRRDRQIKLTKSILKNINYSWTKAGVPSYVGFCTYIFIKQESR